MFGGERQVHLTGAVDYVLLRHAELEGTESQDYKLHPGSSPNCDLFQVYAYALMHRHQA